MTAPTYHDLHITAPGIPRKSIFNLPYGLEVSCCRVTGWQLWDVRMPREQSVLIGGEYDGPEHWLILDVAGHVIVDSYARQEYHPLDGPQPARRPLARLASMLRLVSRG